MMTTSNEHNNAPAVPQDRIDKAKRAVKDLADEAQANGNSEAWVSAQERLILSVIDAATPAPAPAQEVATLSLAAEDVHAAFAKNFPKSRISQAWINFAADIAQAIAARAAKPAQEVDEAQLQKLRENGAKAWAGVDANALRAGYEPAQEVGLTEQRTYRLIQAGIDKIEAADEFLSDDTNTWAVDPNGIFVGATYMGNVLRPARRAIIAALRAKGHVCK